MSNLIEVAEETVRVAREGRYTLASGRVVEIEGKVARAVTGTVLHRPEELARMLAEKPAVTTEKLPRITVTDETTGDAGKRLTADGSSWVALNFASARNPGGGFLRGAKAQEEDLARCSALYACLQTQPDYYAVNRANPSLLYTDHTIYSPEVPFFRGGDFAFLDEPFVLSVITSPAPNAGEHLARQPEGQAAVDEAMHRRMGMVLAVAEHHGHRKLLLGAWGCGVFRNDPEKVAAEFKAWLGHPRFQGAFDDVVFAVFDRSKGQVNLNAFRRCFAE